MKKVFAVCLGIILIAGTGLAAEKIELKDETDKINYSIGYQIGGDFLKQGWKIKPEIMMSGILDATNHTEARITADEMNAVLIGMKKQLVADQQTTARQADALFLAENAKKEGVVVLQSGVQYKIIKEGSGKKPTLQDNVNIRYKVARPGGKDIATGYPTTEPKIYPMKKALPGLREVLQLMKEGSIWQIVLPPGPAMGMKSEAIEKAGVLVYEMELVSVGPNK